MNRTPQRSPITVGDIIAAIWGAVVVLARWTAIASRALRTVLPIVFTIGGLPVGVLMLVLAK